MITKGVLLAAGKGSRLGAIGQEHPKALLDVGGRPVIGHILAGLGAVSVRDVVVVTGHLGAEIEREIGGGERFGVTVTYRRQERLDGTARALTLTRDWAGDSQFFYGWADIIVRADNYARVVAAAGKGESVVAVNQVDDPWAGAAVYIGEDWRVARMVEKPPRGTSSTHWNNAGLGIAGPEIWDAIEKLEPSARGEYELPRAVAATVAAGHVVRAVPIEGPWFDIGTPDDLERARRAYAKASSTR